MQLSIIITSYKNPELLKVCIDSIKKNYSGLNYEIIVADSCTEEKTVMMAREDYPDIKFLFFTENVGFQYLAKAGYAISAGEYLLILNGDIIIKPNSIEKMLVYLQNNPTVGIIGPQLLNFNETLQLSCFRFYTPLTILYRRTFMGKFGFAKKHLANFLMQDFDHQSIKEVDWLMGSAQMTSRRAIKKIGEMDSRFKMYMEDVDWCRRFWENGYKVVYLPEAQMLHYHGRGSVSKNIFTALFYNKLTWLHILSAIKYFCKYAGKPLPKYN